METWPGDIPTSNNVRPTMTIPVVTAEDTKAMRWSLVPHWSKEISNRYAMHNARIETVDSKPAFRDPWRKMQRCLIPAAGYYEWTPVPGRPKKQKIYIQNRGEGCLFFAGLWDKWNDLLSCTIITQPAAPEIAHIHDRMPVMLGIELGKSWLSELGISTNELITQSQQSRFSTAEVY